MGYPVSPDSGWDYVYTRDLLANLRELGFVVLELRGLVSEVVCILLELVPVQELVAFELLVLALLQDQLLVQAIAP